MITKRDAIDYMAEAPLADVELVIEVAAAIIGVRQRVEAPAPAKPKRGRPSGSKRKPEAPVEKLSAVVREGAG